MNPTSTTGALLVTALLTAASLTACGGGADEIATNTQGLREVRVGTVPVAAVAPVHLAQEQGFFEDEGLDVEIATADSGPALAAAVVSGDMDFGMMGVSAALQGASQRIPIKVIAPSAGSGVFGNSDQKVLVAKGAGIKSWDDLKGGTVGVAALKSGNELSIRGLAEKNGLGENDLKFQAVPIPDMATLLASGDLDAAYVAEPYVQAALATGKIEVLDPDPIGSAFGEGALSSVWITGSDLAQSDPDTVGRFQRAIEKANAYADENEDAVRAIIPTYIDLSQDQVNAMALPSYPAELTKDRIAEWADRMVEFGFIPEKPDLDQLVFEGK